MTVIRGNITTPNITEKTEVLIVDLPELRTMDGGQWVTFMVGTEAMVFAIVGHDEDGTHLIRVRDTGRE